MNKLISFIIINIFTNLAIAQTVDSESTQQNPEAVLSIVEDIINNEEFVLQNISIQRGTLTSLLCVYESPSAIWSIKYCKAKGPTEGSWKSVMAGQLLIKDTDTKIDYYFNRGYYWLEKDPASFLEPMSNSEKKSLSRRMRVYINTRKNSEATFTEPMLPILQNMAQVQKQLIEQSTQLDEQRRTEKLTNQMLEAIIFEQPPNTYDKEETKEIKWQIQQLVTATQLNEQRVAELIELIKLLQLTNHNFLAHYFPPNEENH